MQNMEGVEPMDTIKIDSKQTKMIAHRGLSGLEKENTYPAFVAAANRSYYGIETDVRVTSCDRIIIMHDETTERISLGENNVNVLESSFAELENLVFPDVDGSLGRRDIKIPLLRDYVKICKKYDKVCVIEVKSPFPEKDIKRMVEEIKEMEYLENVIFISFSFENCLNLRKYAPDNDIQWLSSFDIDEEKIKELIDNRLNLDINYHALTKERIDRFHEAGLKVNCWTCDNKEEAEELAALGVDYITSNILE